MTVTWLCRRRKRRQQPAARLFQVSVDKVAKYGCFLVQLLAKIVDKVAKKLEAMFSHKTSHVLSFFLSFQGLRLIREGLMKQATGYQLLEAACKETPLHELPGVIRKMNAELGDAGAQPVELKTVPKPPVEAVSKPPVKAVPKSDTSDADSEAESEPVPSSSTSTVSMVKMEPGKVYHPERHPIGHAGGKYQYEFRCPLKCGATRASRGAMYGHINQEHYKRPLLCTMCDKSFYNPDSIDRHVRKNH